MNDEEDFEPRDTDRLEDLVGEAPEEGDEELVRYLTQFAGAMAGEAELKEEVKEGIEQLASDYEDTLDELDAMESQRDEYREFALQIADLGTDYLNGDQYALEQMGNTLEDAGYDLDVDFYDTSGVQDAMDELEGTVEDAVDRFSDF